MGIGFVLQNVSGDSGGGGVIFDFQSHFDSRSLLAHRIWLTCPSIDSYHSYLDFIARCHTKDPAKSWKTSTPEINPIDLEMLSSGLSFHLQLHIIR